MPKLAVLRVLLHELTTRERAPRVPEPSLIMDDQLNVDAYARAATVDRVLAPVYLYNAAHICDVVRPGDTVVDLGCGPATQLALVAQLNAETSFIGIDLSEPMLAAGRQHLSGLALGNVELRHGDVTDLSAFPDESLDAVTSTLTFHHLPDEDALGRTFREIRRVIKPGAGVYLLDFGRLKSTESMRYFANQYAHRQSPLFTEDYWNSLRAAFSLDAFRAAIRPLDGRARLRTTFLAPYMIAAKSALRRRDDDALAKRFSQLVSELPRYHRTDLNELSRFFWLGGLRTRLIP